MLLQMGLLQDIVPIVAPSHPQEFVSTPNITYGIELAFLFPAAIYQNVSTKREWKDRKNELLYEIASKLEQTGVPTKFFGKDEKQAKGDKWKYWRLKTERGGFEAASPLSPRFDEITKFVLTVRDHLYCLVHPQMNIMHINVDARNATLQQARNVYKNAMAVEPALELFSPIDPYHLGGKAMPLSMNFSSVQQAYQSLDASDEFSKLIWLGLPNWNSDHWRIRYRVALKLSRDDHRIPQAFEFRILGSSNPAVDIAWIKLATRLVEESYSGHVLEPKERSTEEAVAALFDELLNEPLLLEFFQEQHDTQDELERMNEEICSRPYLSLKVQTHLCQFNETIIYD